MAEPKEMFASSAVGVGEEVAEERKGIAWFGARDTEVAWWRKRSQGGRREGRWRRCWMVGVQMLEGCGFGAAITRGTNKDEDRLAR